MGGFSENCGWVGFRSGQKWVPSPPPRGGISNSLVGNLMFDTKLFKITGSTSKRVYNLFLGCLNHWKKIGSKQNASPEIWNMGPGDPPSPLIGRGKYLEKFRPVGQKKCFFHFSPKRWGISKKVSGTFFIVFLVLYHPEQAAWPNSSRSPRYGHFMVVLGQK